MFEAFWGHAARLALASTIVASVGGLLLSCGGGSSSSEKDSGANKTYLRIEAADPDGNALRYEWRATAGTIENRNSNETVWTMPEGPGLHFAYVTVSDGNGGYFEQQYAVASDALNTAAPTHPTVVNTPSAAEFAGGTIRLRFKAADPTYPLSPRNVYLPDIQVRVVDNSTNLQVFAGVSDLGGELALPKLQSGQGYTLSCSTSQGIALNCPTQVFTLTGAIDSRTEELSVTAPGATFIYGHLDLIDHSVCGRQSEFFNLQASATVELLRSDGTSFSPPAKVKVNQFGDYGLYAQGTVPPSVNGKRKLRIQCENHLAIQDVAAESNGGFNYVIPNSRPYLVKMVANGPDGNVRGKMILPLSTDFSNQLAGANHFLTFKGRDTRLSACKYYQSFGAVGGCDTQGRMINPISLEQWKRDHHFQPYGSAQDYEEVSATYINQRDLNLVRRMVANKKRSGTGNGTELAFYVCNHPGPVGLTQREADLVIDTGLTGDKRVACVAMAYSATPGTNNGLPFTKFLTFGPDGALLASVNLDGRGEKYLPGACVACHGGTQYVGRFPDAGSPSPNLAATFLPFDTGNFVFSTRLDLTETAQAAALRKLNQFVLDTNPTDATRGLIEGWYGGPHLPSPNLDKNYLPTAWRTYAATTAGAGADVLYQQVVSTSCRTCHTAMVNHNWDGADSDSIPPLITNLGSTLSRPTGSRHICGGGPDLHVNASMPNALISRDRLQDQLQRDAQLSALVERFFGCKEPAADPLYPKK